MPLKIHSTVAILATFALIMPSIATSATNEFRLPWIQVSTNERAFVEAGSGKKFTPWGFNYDRDHKMRLLEDYWDAEWQTVVEDFLEMKTLGANVVRIHLQFAKFMDTPEKPNTNSLRQLTRLTKLADETGLYLDLTGLGCYRKSDTPRWYDDLTETNRWRAQAKFWEAIAETCKESPAVFCYDLMNEPFVPGKARDPGDWLAGKLGEFHYVQALTLDRKGRAPSQVVEQWTAHLVAAIRKRDQRHTITIGMLPISGADFVKSAGKHLDFIAVHEYPEAGKIDESLKRLKVFDIGKPVVIEETFPLKCSFEEMENFLEASRASAGGWISFYWGQTPAELARADKLPEAIVGKWLKEFQRLKPSLTR